MLLVLHDPADREGLPFARRFSVGLAGGSLEAPPRPDVLVDLAGLVVFGLEKEKIKNGFSFLLE